MLTLVDRGIAGKLAYVHVGIPSRVASIWTSSVGTATGGVIYYHRDPHGSVIATSQNGGNEGVAYRYTAFGDSKTVSGTETDGNSPELGYSGALRLSNGVLHMHARDYWALTRRFLQPDDIDIRRYAYAGGDPVSRFDPTGHDDMPGAGIPSVSVGSGGPGDGWGPLAPIINWAGNCVIHGDCIPHGSDGPQKPAQQPARHFGAAPGIGLGVGDPFTAPQEFLNNGKGFWAAQEEAYNTYQNTIPLGMVNPADRGTIAAAWIKTLQYVATQYRVATHSVLLLTSVVAPVEVGAESLSATVTSGDALTLYRTVAEAEVQAIRAAGNQYTILAGGVEGKYFYPTVEQAVALARANYSTQGPQTFTSIIVRQSLLDDAYIGHVAGEGRIVFLPSSSFPLGPVSVWPFIPLSF
jgi:RHS repeat-associated protein